jgi:hypothetical protein
MVDISNGVNMHELTKQLARQAELLQFVNGMTCYRQQHKLEKFAQLIVGECAMIADTERSNSLGCGYITKTNGMRIKEHFGIEL